MDFSSNNNVAEVLNIHSSTTSCSSNSSDHRHGLTRQQTQLARHSSAQVNHADTAPITFNNSLALDGAAPAPAPATDGDHDDKNISLNYSNYVIPLKYSTDSPRHNISTPKLLSSITTTTTIAAAPTIETNNPAMSILMDSMQHEQENISLMNHNTPSSYYNLKHELANAVGGMRQTHHAVTLQKRKALDPLPLINNNVILDQQQRQLQAARPLKLLKGRK